MTTWSRLACAAIAAASAAIPATAAYAAFNSQARATHGVRSLVLEPPTNLSVTTSDACGHVTVSWAASSDADGYRVQVREGVGPWVDAATITGDVTSVEDAAGHVAADVTYRVYARDSRSGWESEAPIEASPLAC